MPRDPAEMARRVLAEGLEPEAGGWSLDPAPLAFVLGEVAGGRRRVVECGSGTSTVAIARLLRRLGEGHVWALEHAPRFAARTRSRLESEGLAEGATVLDAPLRPLAIAVAECGWYEEAALAQLPPSGIELLLVDGPPAPEHEPENARSRYPALPILAPRLAPGATVVCDDSERPGERWALERWRRELGLDFERHSGGFAVARTPA